MSNTDITVAYVQKCEVYPSSPVSNNQKRSMYYKKKSQVEFEVRSHLLLMFAPMGKNHHVASNAFDVRN